MAHHLIIDVIVLGVQDIKAGQRVAALIVADTESADQNNNLRLLELYRWLILERQVLAYQLPTMLRIVGKKQDLPLTGSGKIMKTKVRDIFFNEAELSSSTVEVFDVDVHYNRTSNRPFD